MKTSELTGPALRWAVAKCEGWTLVRNPDINWAQGGPIIEREGMDLQRRPMGYWVASLHRTMEGPTPLIAAMRCYVASKMGDEVDITDELV